MKLVIDVPEKVYQNAKEDMLSGSELIVNAIKNGVPQETVTEFADRCKECGAKYGRQLKHNLREIDDYENEIEDLHNRLNIAEGDKERLREEVTNLETQIKALEQEPKTDILDKRIKSELNRIKDEQEPCEDITKEYINFIDLSDDKIKQIVNDIFSPKKITCIKRSKKWDEITCKIYTEWEGDKESGEDVLILADDLTLKDPFIYGEGAIHVDMSIRDSDYRQLKQFCVANRVYPEWYKNNPYKEQIE